MTSPSQSPPPQPLAQAPGQGIPAPGIPPNMPAIVPPQPIAAAAPAPPTPHPQPGRPHGVTAELLKILTTRTWWVLGIFSLVATGLMLLINGIFADSAVSEARKPYTIPEGAPSSLAAQMIADHDLAKVIPREAANLYTSGQYVGLLLVMILGILIVTNEFSQQTATATFLATPKRERVVLAKIAAVGLFAVGLWVVTTLVDLAIGAAVMTDAGASSGLEFGPVDRAIGINLVAYLLWAVLGIGIGLLIRNQTGAVVTAAVLYLVGAPLANLLAVMVYGWLKADWILQAPVAIPTVASQIMIKTDPEVVTAVDTGLAVQPQWWVGLIIMISWGVLAGLVGTLLSRARDIS